MTLSIPASPGMLDSAPGVRIDKQGLTAPVLSGRLWVASFHKQGGHWWTGPRASEHSVMKRHGSQGPIDDAFMDSFIIVRPTGKALGEKAGRWTTDAMTAAIKEWRLQFRGEPRVVNDMEITPAEIAENNLVLWGDPGSNRLLQQIISKLPFRWDARGLSVNGKKYTGHMALMIYPNPLNPKRYVVLNSGFTFAAAASTSNALQIPELPDYAVVDADTQKVSDAGFFDEHWDFRSRR